MNSTPNATDDGREAFEAWLRSEGALIPGRHHLDALRYSIDETESMWAAWQASRLLPAIPQALPEIIRILAEWEDANGSLCAAMYDEWIALYKPITNAAVNQSPRMIRTLLSAAPPAPKSEVGGAA